MNMKNLLLNNVNTKDVIDNLNDNYIKQLGKQNIQGKDILTLANDMKLFE